MTRKSTTGTLEAPHDLKKAKCRACGCETLEATYEIETTYAVEDGKLIIQDVSGVHCFVCADCGEENWIEL